MKPKENEEAGDAGAAKQLAIMSICRNGAVRMAVEEGENGCREMIWAATNRMSWKWEKEEERRKSSIWSILHSMTVSSILFSSPTSSGAVSTLIDLSLPAETSPLIMIWWCRSFMTYQWSTLTVWLIHIHLFDIHYLTLFIWYSTVIWFHCYLLLTSTDTICHSNPIGYSTVLKWYHFLEGRQAVQIAFHSLTLLLTSPDTLQGWVQPTATLKLSDTLWYITCCSCCLFVSHLVNFHSEWPSVLILIMMFIFIWSCSSTIYTTNWWVYLSRCSLILYFRWLYATHSISILFDVMEAILFRGGPHSWYTIHCSLLQRTGYSGAWGTLFYLDSTHKMIQLIHLSHCYTHSLT